MTFVSKAAALTFGFLAPTRFESRPQIGGPIAVAAQQSSFVAPEERRFSAVLPGGLGEGAECGSRFVPVWQKQRVAAGIRECGDEGSARLGRLLRIKKRRR